MFWMFVITGLVLLTLGAEWLIRGATSIARRFGLSELLIGLTLVGFGTSMPELVSSVGAALAGSPGVAVGNVVGSNIANILLILGVSAAIMPINVKMLGFRRDALVLGGVTLGSIAIMFTGELSRLAGIGFIVALIAYVGWAYRGERAKPSASAEAINVASMGNPGKTMPAIGFAMIGLLFLVIGARLLVDGAIGIATMLNIPETLIGLTVVAVGTSLPELMTSVMASLRGKSDLALGNVLGSNIYNLLGILGVTALVQPITVPETILAFDNWVMLGATGALIAFAVTKRQLERWEGALMALAYAIYLGYLVFQI
ncbi:calcium/sodium antiporter [Hyphococcus sp. DH-69]|uniref:calcium/sodium antiporter n=1 Tax=Hyphococcus formosus TaxID=3143534 RepID=UPI00398B0DD7